MIVASSISQPTLYSSENKPEAAYGLDPEATVHILHILRSQLYSNKILAVIREYSTNAHDAHIVANNTEPIHIKLPTVANPSFEVRDFGHGLTEVEIFTTYTKVGRSTKRNTNKLNGFIGIGAKSAFSYVDSFLIESFKNGTKHIYNAVLDASGIGKIIKLSSVKTAESDGLKVIIPVKGDDIVKFTDEAKNFYKYFRPYPQISPVLESKPTELSDEDLLHLNIPDKLIYTANRRTVLTLVMANVTYRFTSGEVISIFKTHIAFGELTLFLPTGSIAVAASREAIELTEFSLNAITSAIINAASIIKAKIEEDLKNTKNIGIASRILDHCPIHAALTWTGPKSNYTYTKQELKSIKLNWRRASNNEAIQENILTSNVPINKLLIIIPKNSGKLHTELTEVAKSETNAIFSTVDVNAEGLYQFNYYGHNFKYAVIEHVANDIDAKILNVPVSKLEVKPSIEVVQECDPTLPTIFVTLTPGNLLIKELLELQKLIPCNIVINKVGACPNSTPKKIDVKDNSGKNILKLDMRGGFGTTETSMSDGQIRYISDTTHFLINGIDHNLPRSIAYGLLGLQLEEMSKNISKIYGLKVHTGDCRIFPEIVEIPKNSKGGIYCEYQSEAFNILEILRFLRLKKEIYIVSNATAKRFKCEKGYTHLYKLLQVVMVKRKYVLEVDNVYISRIKNLIKKGYIPATSKLAIKLSGKLIPSSKSAAIVAYAATIGEPNPLAENIISNIRRNYPMLEALNNRKINDKITPQMVTHYVTSMDKLL